MKRFPYGEKVCEANAKEKAADKAGKVSEFVKATYGVQILFLNIAFKNSSL